jgi:hypothetical protein
MSSESNSSEDEADELFDCVVLTAIKCNQAAAFISQTASTLRRVSVRSGILFYLGIGIWSNREPLWLNFYKDSSTEEFEKHLR